ncbi:histidine kinase [uncultured Draconibacterium sp.]|uniref:sensor histidine kinase n=1 Tax=uncultured Draconibacterium sp. TaxID=1573823 RepID=UPI003261A9CB
MRTTLKPNTNFSRVQFQIMLFIWLLIFAIPLLAGDTSNGIAWEHISKIWTEYGFVFVVFLINHYLLFPQFLKGRRILYFVSVFCILVLLVLVSYFFGNTDAPPADAMQAMRPPGEGPLGPPPHGKGPREFIPPSGNLLIISILMIGFDAGLSFAGKWLQAEQNKIILEKENVENKMAFLQNQVSPHFFMNTLNNIHALVDINTEEAKEAIIRLSNMMAYMLYESQTDKISIQKEIDFVKSYVELMKLRFSEEVDINVEIPEKLPEIAIPPLLTISFIENAFKHGVSYEEPSFIHIKYVFKKDHLYFELKNSNHSKQEKNANSGIGLENARKRLALIYTTNYELNINQPDNKVFSVSLKLPL